MIFLNDLKFFIPELFLSISILTLVLYTVISNHYNTITINIVKDSVVFTILIAIITALIFTLQPFADFILFESQLTTNFFTYVFKFIIIMVFVSVLIISFNYFNWELIRATEIPLLMIISISGMFLIINSNDFITLYMGMELQSLSFYVLTASKKYSNLSSEAGLKYFILGSLASAFLLFGVSIFYGYTGTTNFFDIKLLLLNIPTEISISLYLGILFILVGLLFKLPAAPLHNWAPDVYDGAAGIVTAFFCIDS